MGILYVTICQIFQSLIHLPKINSRTNRNRLALNKVSKLEIQGLNIKYVCICGEKIHLCEIVELTFVDRIPMSTICFAANLLQLAKLVL